MVETTARSADPGEGVNRAGGGPAPERHHRMSAKRKQSAVLRLLRDDDPKLVAREFGVTSVELSAWRDAFLAAGVAALKTRPADVLGDAVIERLRGELGRLKEKVGELTMTKEQLEMKIERLEGGYPTAYRRPRR